MSDMKQIRYTLYLVYFYDVSFTNRNKLLGVEPEPYIYNALAGAQEAHECLKLLLK
jgi:hypothetical protein